jgi:hypothetical protein
MTWRARNFLPSGLPRSTHRRPPLPRRSHAIPKIHHRHRLHLPVPHRGGTGGPRHRSGTHRPLTKPRRSTPLRPSAEERMPHRRPWSRTLGSSPGWSQIRWKGWRNKRMRMPWQKGKQDGAVAIGLRKEMDAQCVDAGLNKGWKGYGSMLQWFPRSRISKGHVPCK